MRNKVLEFAKAEIDSTDRDKYCAGVGLRPPFKGLSWCGIFALWCLRQAGLTVFNWRLGVGFVLPLGLKLTKTPQPGDILVLKKYWHHGIVEKVENGIVYSIDGNLSNKVQRKARPINTIDYFYSIDTLIRDRIKGV